jgi:hypothetical protein
MSRRGLRSAVILAAVMALVFTAVCVLCQGAFK